MITNANPVIWRGVVDDREVEVVREADGDVRVVCVDGGTPPAHMMADAFGDALVSVLVRTPEQSAAVERLAKFVEVWAEARSGDDMLAMAGTPSAIGECRVSDLRALLAMVRP